MKKLIIALSVLALSATVVPAHADIKSLVIIDSYFDSKVIGGNVSCITLQAQPCTDVVTTKPSNLSDNINHGNAMVEVAKKQNPNLKIVLIRAGSPSARSVSDVNAGSFIEALKWVDANKNTVGAVAISRYFNGSKPCTPASVNTAPYGGVVGADNTIRAQILSLKSSGVPVFVATGNKFKGAVDYPACILDTNSVGVGSVNKAGIAVSTYSFDNNTDYFADSSIRNYGSTIFGSIPNTTSAGNVAVAAQYVSGKLVNKFVNVLN